MAAASSGNASSASTGGSSVSGNIGTGPQTTTPGGQVAASGNQSDFMSALQDQLMGAAGAVSSNGSTIDSQIQGAISSLNAGQKTTDVGLASQNTADINTLQQQGNNNMTAQLEARRGMATNTGIVQNVILTTNKSINDLEEKYQAAISTGDAATAAKVADLQVQALQMKQTTLEQAFSNMTSIAGTMNTAQQTQIAQQTQNFAEQQAVANIGLQFGIKVTPGMTLAQMVSAAAPKASVQQQAQLGLVIAQTQAANEQAAASAAGVAQLITPDNSTAFASSLVQAVATLGAAGQSAASNIIANAAKQPNGTAMLQDAIQNLMTNSSGTGVYDSGTLDNNITSALGQAKTNAQLQTAVSQLQSQYTSGSQGYGQFATPAQMKAASDAIINQENAVINKIAPQSQFSPAYVIGQFFNRLTGNPTPEK